MEENQLLRYPESQEKTKEIDQQRLAEEEVAQLTMQDEGGEEQRKTDNDDDEEGCLDEEGYFDAEGVRDIWSDTCGLSKNEWKRQMRAKAWPEQRAKLKAKKKEEKIKKREERIALGLSVPLPFVKKQKEEHVDPYRTSQMLRSGYSSSARAGQPVILDMQFVSQLQPKEFKSLVKQLCYMQSSNKKAPTPVRFMITSTTPELRAALYKNNADKWGTEILDEHYLDLFQKEKLVYLTGDTDQDLEELDPEVGYIIGGLVDHNRLKNVTLDAATAQGLAVKRFPISRFLRMETSSILACNHVFDIMLRRANGEEWKESLLNSIPVRKVVATVEDGVEVKTQHFLKKLEAARKQQLEAELKKKAKTAENEEAGGLEGVEQARRDDEAEKEESGDESDNEDGIVQKNVMEIAAVVVEEVGESKQTIMIEQASEGNDL